MNQVQRSYDTVADEYVRRIYNELEGKPLDRQLLERFVLGVPASGNICDLGCGPGHVTKYLKDCGAKAEGLDLSEKLLAYARALNPGIPFQQGDMRALPFADESLDGITAFYSIVNFSPEELPRVFREMSRTLKANAPLLLAFHIGDEKVHLDEWWDLPVSVDFFFFNPNQVASELTAAGFKVLETIVRDPYPEVEHPSRRAYLFCQKRGRAPSLAEREGARPSR